MDADDAAPSQPDPPRGGSAGAVAMLTAVIGTLLLCVAMALVASAG